MEVKDTKYGTFEALLFYIYNDKIKFEEDDYENIFGKHISDVKEFYNLLKARKLFSAFRIMQNFKFG